MRPSRQTTRRSFLQQLGTTGLGAWTLSSLSPGSVFGAAANSKLNIALLGCGNRARQLLPSILSAGENIVALCDVDASQVERLKKEGAGKKAGPNAMLEKAKVYTGLSPVAERGRNRWTLW